MWLNRHDIHVHTSMSKCQTSRNLVTVPVDASWVDGVGLNTLGEQMDVPDRGRAPMYPHGKAERNTQG